MAGANWRSGSDADRRRVGPLPRREPSDPCTRRTWDSIYGGGAAHWDSLDRVRDDPLARRIWPGDLDDRALRLWYERGHVMQALDHLPQSFGHDDADRRNLFVRRCTAGESSLR
jgi:hypothetical protein